MSQVKLTFIYLDLIIYVSKFSSGKYVLWFTAKGDIEILNNSFYCTFTYPTPTVISNHYTWQKLFTAAIYGLKLLNFYLIEFISFVSKELFSTIQQLYQMKRWKPLVALSISHVLRNYIFLVPLPLTLDTRTRHDT